MTPPPGDCFNKRWNGMLCEISVLSLPLTKTEQVQDSVPLEGAPYERGGPGWQVGGAGEQCLAGDDIRSGRAGLGLPAFVTL